MTASPTITVDPSPLPGGATLALRQVVIAVGSWAAARHYVAGDTAAMLAAVVPVAGVAVWGQLRRYVDHRALTTVAASPANPDVVFAGVAPDPVAPAAGQPAASAAGQPRRTTMKIFDTISGFIPRILAVVAIFKQLLEIDLPKLESVAADVKAVLAQLDTTHAAIAALPAPVTPAADQPVDPVTGQPLAAAA